VVHRTYSTEALTSPAQCYYHNQSQDSQAGCKYILQILGQWQMTLRYL